MELTGSRLSRYAVLNIYDYARRRRVLRRDRPHYVTANNMATNDERRETEAHETRATANERILIWLRATLAVHSTHVTQKKFN